MNQFNLIIPCARLTGIDMQNEFGPIPPGMTPLNGKIALERIIASYGALSFQVYIGIEEKYQTVEEYFNFFIHPNVHLVHVKNSVSIGDTIEQIFLQHPQLVEAPVLLNFADTIVLDLPGDVIGKDFVIYAHSNETERWTLFRRVEDKVVISDKKYQSDAEEWNLFVGVWGFASGGWLLDRLHENNVRNKKTSFYETIGAHFSSNPGPALVETNRWLDLGHVDNYYSARLQEISHRYFNELKVNRVVGSIYKTSQDTKKLINEIRWFIGLPKELYYFIPHIYDYSTNLLAPYIEMEFYSYPSLSDCFVYARFDFDTWEKIFAKVFEIIRTAGKYTVKETDYRSDLEQIYLKKTVDRLQDFLDSQAAGNTSPEPFPKADQNLLDRLEGIKEKLPGILEKNGLFTTSEFQIIHGDLCFSNILYDNKHGIVKLIDPRGQFGRFGIYGDIYYDLAKLSHSVLGFYDFIMFDQFSIERMDGIPKIRWRASDYHHRIGEIFIKYLRRNGFDLQRVRLLESLLFLSMLPIHSDKPDRQKAMLIQGLNIMENYEL